MALFGKAILGLQEQSVRVRKWKNESGRKRNKKYKWLHYPPDHSLKSTTQFLGHEGHLQDRMCESNLAWTVFQEEDKRNWSFCLWFPKMVHLCQTSGLCYSSLWGTELGKLVPISWWFSVKSGRATGSQRLDYMAKLYFIVTGIRRWRQ